MNATKFCKAAELWLYSCNTHNTLSTISKYEQLIANHISPCFSDRTCASITQAEMECFYRSLCQSPRRLSDSNLRTVAMLLNKIMEYAYQQAYVETLLHITPRLSKRKPIVRVFTDSERIKLENYVYSHHEPYTMAVFLALYTGMRLGEICAVKWSDFDFERGALQITKTVQRLKCPVDGDSRKTRLIVTPPKSNASFRVIPLPDFAIPYIYEGFSKEKKEFYVIASNANIPQDPRTVQYAYKKMLNMLGISYLNFHCLRHTFATRCVTNGWDVKTLSEILGHNDIKITMDYYFHSSFKYKKQQMNKIAPFS